jgi:TadE-like protein
MRNHANPGNRGSKVLQSSTIQPVAGSTKLSTSVPTAGTIKVATDGQTERGATAVESAIVLSLLLLLFIAIIEFSILMTSRANMKSAVNAAVRVGSIASNSPDSDYLILKEINADLSGRVELVDYVIVFNANTAIDSQPPPQCVSAANSGSGGLAIQQCNIYNKSVLAAPNTASFGYDPVTKPAAFDKFWPAKTRSATYSGGRDLLGVYIASRSKSITGIVPKIDMRTVSILRIEAQDV